MPSSNWPTVTSWPAATAWPSSASWPGFTPASLSDLALWLDGRQTTYSDAGVTLASVPYGRIAQIAQPSPLSGNWTSSGVNRSWRDAAALDFHNQNPSSLTQPASVAIPNNNCTLGLAIQHRHGQLATYIFKCRDGLNANDFGLFFTSESLYLYTGGGFTLLAAAPVHGTARIEVVITCTASNIVVVGAIDGNTFSVNTGLTPASGGLGTIALGSYSGQSTHGSISQFFAYSQAKTTGQAASLLAFLRANAAPYPPSNVDRVIMSGDSICASWYPTVQTSLDGNATPPRWINTGVSGATVAQIAGFYPTAIAPLITSGAKTIVVVEGWTNSLIIVPPGQGPAVAASVLADQYAYCDVMKAAGIRVILTTCTPATPAQKPGAPDFEIARGIINTDVLANFAAHGTRVADFGNTPGMATPADAAGANFSDGLHWSNAGYILQNAVLLAAITAELAAP